ncbi:MAG: GntR family transcriptional regulator [Pseudomonadota bacterium]
MKTKHGPGWRAIHGEARRRITERIWAPGARIPVEAALAEEFGVARATVNRAIRALADEGLVERRRKGGTRVVEAPRRQARAAIPLIREEIEATGAQAAYRLIPRPLSPPQKEIAALFGGAAAKQVAGLHLADGAPFVLEDRWINIEAAPEAARIAFDDVSANEWLVRNAPFTDGDIAMSARAASRNEAEALGVEPGAPLLIVERTTRADGRVVTVARLAYAPGYAARLTI